jgi:two-component system response regulator MprA
MRVLVVDDDPAVSGALNRALRLEGYDVSLAVDGGHALEEIAIRPPDAVILDIGLPGIDGLEVCRRLRAADNDTPVLMLTARDAINDRVQGLDVGADDYLVKPFALAELLARLRALLRRRPDDVGDVLRFADLALDPVTREASRGDRQFTLTRIEFDLLELLLRHPRQVLTRELIHLRLGHQFARRLRGVPATQNRGRRRAAVDPHGPGCRLRPARAVSGLPGHPSMTTRSR